MPDANLVIHEVSKDSINLDIQINDVIMSEYHRDNGFSKMSFKIVDKKDFEFLKENQE